MSATFDMSTIASSSLGHSTNVKRCRFEVTTVIGP
jgi:hypothetical protein